MLLYLLSHSCSTGSARNRNLGTAEEIFDREVDLKTSICFYKLSEITYSQDAFVLAVILDPAELAALAAPGLEFLALLKKSLTKKLT